MQVYLRDGCQEHCVTNHCIRSGWRVGMLKFVMYLKQNKRIQFFTEFLSSLEEGGLVARLLSRER